MEERTLMGWGQEALKLGAAAAIALGLMFAVAFSLDASSMRVVFGVSPPLDVPYVTTRPEMVDAMLDMAEVSEEDYVIDLGTGDGRILLAAARDYGARGLGVDLDPVLVERARSAGERKGLSEQVSFAEQDLFETPLSEADVVTMFLLPDVNVELRPRLLAEMKPGSRVVSHAFDMGEWQPDAERLVGGRMAYLWIIPANVAGTWRITFDGGELVLELEQTFQEVEGRALLNGEDVRLDATLRGDQLRIRVDLPDGERVFLGVVRGDRFSEPANTSWEGFRQPE